MCFSPMHVGKDWIEHSHQGRKQKSPTGSSSGRHVSASHLRFMILALEGSILLTETLRPGDTLSRILLFLGSWILKPLLFLLFLIQTSLVSQHLLSLCESSAWLCHIPLFFLF